ncbi:PREDICTED: homeobox protein Hox-A4-like [Chinchilla lanigera]|uniref:homeobox protein Hox-A4-like n=1 Tax=Chinchilla lanigera TaxID=34839 RepID=UPI000696D567|nr:PREDICTED: homeobox protein Hox-A4-like [Chinchilla lanigera]
MPLGGAPRGRPPPPPAELGETREKTPLRRPPPARGRSARGAAPLGGAEAGRAPRAEASGLSTELWPGARDQVTQRPLGQAGRSGSGRETPPVGSAPPLRRAPPASAHARRAGPRRPAPGLAAFGGRCCAASESKSLICNDEPGKNSMQILRNTCPRRGIARYFEIPLLTQSAKKAEGSGLCCGNGTARQREPGSISPHFRRSLVAGVPAFGLAERTPARPHDAPHCALRGCETDL